ncbi:hypothetical protein GCM10007216_29500 [Thalassobacillus devorans]|uniref:DUF6933 domain-containing protein n=1 Tax=Thalassobacillus devorans TaxID=279813 RepID=A0ABQ1PHA9_9BACI|nr:hypothetical protein [Thalassobacillus devorans]NIK29455.1 hypothetical protein [Thalassobacillus devorans]GGC96817.1 hypothetical protein GCM10007216_29500 [Thalassobacillus devorans]
MMQIGATAKMAKELKREIQSADSVEVPKIYQWHMNFFTIQRRKCVLLMNDETGLNLTLFGLKQEQFKNIDQVLMGSLRELLRLLKVDQTIIDDFLEAGQEIVYTKTHDRRVLGMMNEVKSYMEHGIIDQSYDEIDAIKVNEENNQIILSPLKKMVPLDTLNDYFQEK